MAQNKFFGADNLECRARIDALNDGCLNCLGKKKQWILVGYQKMPIDRGKTRKWMIWFFGFVLS